MIKVKHLNKAFGSIPVLRDLNLTVNGPLVLMGPSGCGKTTLLRILMGLETPDSGTVQGVGNIGAVFQESRLCPQLTAVGNICLVGGVNPAQAQAELQTLGFTQAELALPVARLPEGSSDARRCCGRCCASPCRPCCWTNPLPAWTQSWSATPLPRWCGWPPGGIPCW